jgi:hypothetical protein
MRTLTRPLLLAATLSALGACSPAALTPDEVVPAFIAASQSDTRTMRMEWQGTVATGDAGLPGDDSTASVNGIFDFNGPDYAGTMTVGVAGSSVGKISYARVGDISFVNYSDSGWQRADGFGSAPGELDPMIGLTAADVTYEDAQDLNGRQVHRVRVIDPLAAVRGFFGGLAAFGTPTLNRDGEGDYLIYVDAAGIPVAAHVVLDMKMDVPFETETSSVDYRIRWDYTFSQWGEPVTISPPTVVGGGGLDFPQPPPGP